MNEEIWLQNVNSIRQLVLTAIKTVDAKSHLVSNNVGAIYNDDVVEDFPALPHKLSERNLPLMQVRLGNGKGFLVDEVWGEENSVWLSSYPSFRRVKLTLDDTVEGGLTVHATDGLPMRYYWDADGLTNLILAYEESEKCMRA